MEFIDVIMCRKMYFIVLTTYQLFISDVYAKYLKKEYPNSIIKIFAVGLNIDWFSNDYEYISIPFLNGNKKDRILQRLVWAGRLFFTTPIYSYFKCLSYCNLFVFNDNEPITNRIIREASRDRSNKIIIIEEGIGIYEKTKCKKLNLKQNLRLLLTWMLGSPMQYKAVGENDFISYAIVGEVELYEQLDKAQNQIVIRQNKIAIYSQAAQFLNRLGISCNDYSDYPVVYIGQPINEYGEMVDREKEYISSLINNFGKILIKPHPRDLKGKYDDLIKEHKNCKVLEDELSILPFESLIGALSVEVVISINSSAGINIAKTFPNIKCVFTYDMSEAKKCIELLNNGYVEMNKKLFTSPYDNVLIPKSIEELNDAMSIIKKNNYKKRQLEINYELTEMKKIVEITNIK